MVFGWFCGYFMGAATVYVIWRFKDSLKIAKTRVEKKIEDKLKEI